MASSAPTITNHLLDVGPGHRLHAADHRVGDGRHADEGDGPVRSQPNTAESTTAGAAMMVPQDIPRESRKRMPSASASGLKRRSRYSYAV
jgi:hypothetical protein